MPRTAGSEYGAGDAFDTGRMDAVLADVMLETGASVGLVYLLVPEDRLLRLALVSGAPRLLTAPWIRVRTDAPLPLADAVRARELVWLCGREEVARRYPRLGIVLPYDFMLAAAPVLGGDRVWGGVVLLRPTWQPPRLDVREREAIRRFGARTAGLLERHADRGGTPSSPHDPRVIRPAPPSTADPTLGTAALAFAERLPVGCCALDLDGRVSFINAAGATLVDAGPASLLGRRPWEALAWMRDPLFEDRYRAAVISRRPVSFVVRRAPDRSLRFRLYPDDTGISVHITPAADTPADGPAAPGTPPAPTPPPAAEPVGATALYHLMHLAAALTEAAGVRDVVELVADQIVPAFGPQGLVLMTVNEGRLRIIGHRGYDQDFIDRYDGTPLTAEVADAQVLHSGVPVFFPTVDDLRRAHPSAPRFGTRSAWAFLPLIASGRPVGSLILSYDRQRPFPPAERALLTSLAGLIAQALDRARLYDAERTLARTFQTSLLPQKLIALHGLDVAVRYLPAGRGMDIGGDFYDLIHATPTTAAAVIGDVQGHNTTAVALMGQVRTAVHAHATAGASPGDILARTNRMLTDLDPGLFTSCLIAELDLARGRVRFATAGHPPPLLRGPDGRTDIPVVPPGLLLGIDPRSEYPVSEMPLPQGSLLALYTDGLVEVPGADIGDAIADLARHLARSDVQDLDRLADDLVRQAEGTTHRTDDIALLLVRYDDEGRGMPPADGGGSSG